MCGALLLGLIVNADNIENISTKSAMTGAGKSKRFGKMNRNSENQKWRQDMLEAWT